MLLMYMHKLIKLFNSILPADIQFEFNSTEYKSNSILPADIQLRKQAFKRKCCSFICMS